MADSGFCAALGVMYISVFGFVLCRGACHGRGEALCASLVLGLGALYALRSVREMIRESKGNE